MSTNNNLKSETLAPSWTYRGTYGALTEPLISAGDRVIGVAGSTIFAVDLHTGELVRAPNAQPKKNWPYGPLSYEGGDAQVTAAGSAVYFMDDNKLMAVRLSDGSPIPGWKPQPLKSVSNLFAREGHLVAVHLDPRGGTLVSGYDPIAGNRVFGPVKISTQRAGRVAYGNGALFFVTSGKLNAVNVDFGDLRWQVPVSGDSLDAAVTPLVTENMVVVAGNRLHGIDIVTGRVKWSVAPSTGGTTRWTAPAAYQPVPAVAATRAANARAAVPTADVPNPAAAVAAASAAGVAVATNAAGDIMGVSILDGNVLWQKSAQKPGPPTIIEKSVLVTTSGGTLLARYDLYTGNQAGTPYALPNLSSKQAPVIANGAIHLADDVGNITARPFSSQQAAYFDGSYSRIDINADDKQFDFGLEDFTVEAWFRGSSGGELVSSYPTKDLNGHGFRLNVGSDGSIRVAVTRSNGSVVMRGRTRGTNAADGEWHHVAMIRRNGSFVVLLDGLSLPVLLPPGDTENVAIEGSCGLTIGAYVATPNGRATGHFLGLIREVRIWDRALDVAAITTNLTVALTGTEPRLRGLWRLDDLQRPGAPTEPRNAVVRRRATAQFLNPASRPTDLIMDRSAYPYLLHEAKTQWPYAGTWAARGESAMLGSPAVSSNGVIAFATNNGVYAVNGHDGARVWSMDVGNAASGIAADGNGFVMMTEDESPFRLDARTGAKTQLKGFERMSLAHGMQVTDPAVSDKYIAAAAADGTVMIVSRVNDHPVTVRIGGPIAGLELGAAGLFVLSGLPSARQLSLIDPDTAGVRGRITLQNDLFCTADNWVLCVRNGMIVRLDSAALSFDAVQATSAKISGTVTGLVACVDEDLLVAVTDEGTVYGLTLGRLQMTWQTRLPVGSAATSRRINPPVLDEDRRIVCTTADGTFAVLDPETGALNGLYSAKRSAVGKPFFLAGTLFTGCEDAPRNDPSADLDGALHSVVFGETMALRLNLDAHGMPVAGGTQHAVIDAQTEDCTLYLMGVHESCVEAWVNIPVLTGADASRAGGGIFSLCPTRESGFDINLWIEPDGRLHYSSRAQEENGTWSGMHVSAETTIIDGKWHHVAVSRMLPLPSAPAGSPDRVVMYIDGHAVGSLVTEAAPQAPLASVIGLRAFIGAVASESMTATRPFVGMIGEVRVWDTYMVSTEIASRMHVKLRGDEADLLAYWNFDYEAVHDCARQGHDGRLAVTPSAPVWWLTDLPFSQPAYPYITSQAKITAQGAGKPTTYALTVKVCRADGSGMADQDVRVWYMKYGPDEPASILVNAASVAGKTSSADMNPGSGPDGSAGVYIGKTASDGTIKLTVTTASPGHGPALDLWTAFMPANERFHVNVLIDNQQLSKPAPPQLTAQAKLIQDYHYTTGNKIDDTRDRSTWRVVLRAADSNDRPCPREQITIWAESSTGIEVSGRSYTVNAENPVTLNAELNGELTLVMAADGLIAATLYARAGFMHRNDRIVIRPDQDTHETLSTMRAEDLTQPKVTNWKKNAGPGDRQSLLAEDQHEHAPKIAEAVRHVTSSVKQSEPDKPLLKSGRPSPARMKLIQMRTGIRPTTRNGLLGSDTIPENALLLDDMRQPDSAPADDQVTLMRTMAGTPREAPVNPEALRKSLKGNLGFVFEKKSTGLRYEMLKTTAQVDKERGRPTVRVMAGSVGALSLESQLLGSFWDDIVDFATDVYNGATKIVITIAEQVEIAIHKMVDGLNNIVHTVVSTIEDAVNAVVGFFEQLAVGIKKLIEFLRVLFDWQAILRTHNILHDTFLAVFDIAVHSLKNTKPFTDSIAALAGVNPLPVPSGLDSLNTATQGEKDDSPASAQANSVQGKSMMQRSSDNPPRSTSSAAGAIPTPAQDFPDNSIDVVVRELMGLFSDILDLSPADLVSRLGDIISKAASLGLVAAGRAVAGIMETLADLVSWTVRALDAKIDIPFISELYKWITGSDLTILDVICLGLAVPVNLAYAVATLVQGGARHFADDAANLPNQLRQAAGLRPRLNAPVPAVAEHSAAVGIIGADAPSVPGTPQAPEIALMVFRIITVATDLVGDLTFIETVVNGEPEVGAEIMGPVGYWQGLAGIISLSVQTFASQKNFEARLRAVADQDPNNKQADQFLPPYPWIVYTLYGVQMALRTIKMGAGIAATFGLGGGGGGLTKIKEGIDFPITVNIGMFIIPHVLDRMIRDLIDKKQKLEAYGNDNVTQEFVLLATRDIVSTVPVLFEWMFTKKGAKTVKLLAPGAASGIYYGVYAVRDICGVASFVLHGVGVFHYGD